MFSDVETVLTYFFFFQKMQILKKCNCLAWFLQGEKNKYFIGNNDDDQKIKQLRIMLSKTSASYDRKTNQMYFLLKMMNYQRNNSVIVLRKNNALE